MLMTKVQPKSSWHIYHCKTHCRRKSPHTQSSASVHTHNSAPPSGPPSIRTRHYTKYLLITHK